MAEKTRKKSKPYHHGRLPEACIKAGLQMLNRGKRDFSLRDIARSVGVSHGALARHFETKEGLVAAIAEEGFRKFNVALEEAKVENDLKETFLKMGRAYFDFGYRHPEHYRMMLGDKIQNHQQYGGLLSESSRAFRQLIEIVAALQKAQIFRAGPPETAAYAIWAAVHGAVNLAIEGHMREDLDTVVDELTQALFQGFRR